MGYSEEQKEYMRSIGLDLDFDNLSDDDWVTLEDTIADRIGESGFEEDGTPTEETLMCESILDLLDYDLEDE